MQINTTDFLTWVKAQPPDDTFNFQSCIDCASCQYLIAHLPAGTEVSALVHTYSIREVSNNWKTFKFPDVLAETFKSFEWNADGGFRFHISYAELVARIEAIQKQMKHEVEE